MPAATTKTNVVSFDAKRKKKGVRYDYQAFGQVWKVKAPNQVLATDLLTSDDIGAMVKFLASFIDGDMREQFMVAVAAEEDFGIDELNLMMEQLAEVVYANIPTPP